MPLVLPNLDDKPFSQIAEEARLLIPSTSPEWTDHNVHDPGITFVELFAWLAEMEHYRLNRVSTSSYERFFSLMGLTRSPARPAEVVVPFETTNLTTSIFIPANRQMKPIGVESIPFETTRDQFLTNARVTGVVTHIGERQIVQTSAEVQDVGHYEAFGPSPGIGDSLELALDYWFTSPEAQLSITLFEDDLPPLAQQLTELAPGFRSSATVRWEYQHDVSGDAQTEWSPLEVLLDGTLNLSRSGELVFRVPTEDNPQVHKKLRLVLASGQYEIPPRIVSIRTNTIRARQVETIVNETLGAGLGSADQVVRLQKAPLFLNSRVDDKRFCAGEVLDWRALINRLNNAANYRSPSRETLSYILAQLPAEARAIVSSRRPPNNVNQPTSNEVLLLASAFNALLENADLYQPAQFVAVAVTPESLARVQEQRCRKTSEVRQFNRGLLQQVFLDLLLSDRLEVQTSVPGAIGDDEGLTWAIWDQVENFERSGPDDRHYVLDSDNGLIYFGNGLNGRVPTTSEVIRARFYRYSQLERGNLPAHRQWSLAVQLPPGASFAKQENLTPAAGGRGAETIDEAKSRSRAVFRTDTPVLTIADYDQLVRNTPGLRVARVKVLPNFNPELGCLKIPGDVTIVVEPQPAPQQSFPDASPVEASDGFLATIRNYVEPRRIVTTNLHIVGPRYHDIRTSSLVFLKKRSSEAEVKPQVDRALSEFFNAASGGPDNLGWEFGRPAFTSEVSQQISQVAGVDYVTSVSINDRKPGDPEPLAYNELPRYVPGNIRYIPFEQRGTFSIESAGEAATNIKKQNCKGKNCG